ncbi:MAG TPA: hypothetical protein VK633_04560 [Verrucomicrobiae bacterium]|nr:hypothetical protein [Verrucomicrobiae bacterium]
MQFLKAHYEKIILSIVLLGLAAVAALMPVRVAQERERQEAREGEITNPKVKEYQPLDLTTNAAVLARLAEPPRLRLAGEHNLFNAVRWQKRADGGLIKISEAGANALEIQDIRPLRFGLIFDEVAGTPQEVRYQLSVLNEVQRAGRPTPRIAGVKEKNNMFTIEEVIGEPGNPTALKVTLAGDKEPVTIGPGKPFEKIIGYTADVRYPPDDKQWKNLKVKDEVTLAGETYNIVAITQNEVVLSAKSNKKQTVLEYKQAPRK